MRDKITQALSPTFFELADDSDRHIGHAGARAEGETHFTLHIVSAAFSGLGRMARQRLVYEVLAEEMRGPIHALALYLNSPEERLTGS